VFVDRAWRFHVSGGSVTELSVTENCHGRGGDGLILHRRVVNYRSILLTIERFG
jgi:hypothetical protein